MLNKHLSEEEIQLFVLDELAADPFTVQHINTCATCKGRAANYGLLVLAIQQQEKPVFDFDLAATILPKIAPPEATGSRPVNIIWLLVAMVICVAVAAVCFFSTILSTSVKNLSSMAIYLIVITAVMILAFQAFDIYKQYQRQYGPSNFN